MNIFEFTGIAGLLLITAGVLIKKRREEDFLYLIGGACLEIYSIYTHDTVFIVLQIIFMLSALYDIVTTKK